MVTCKANSQSILQVFATKKQHSKCSTGSTEKWKAILNKKLKVGALFMDLSKAFDTFDHSQLLSKLSANGFDNNSLSFV